MNAARIVRALEQRVTAEPVFYGRLMEIAKESTDPLSATLAGLLFANTREAMDVIYAPGRNNELERVFLSAVLLSVLHQENPELLVFAAPGASITRDEERFRRLIRLADDLTEQHDEQLDGFEENAAWELLDADGDYAEFEKLREEAADFDAFLDRQLEYGNLSRDEHRALKGDLLRYTVHAEKLLVLTPQAIVQDFPEKGKHIVPDVLVWSPTSPQFRIFVECDGYDYHNDRKQDYAKFVADRKRDREIVLRHWLSLRYSASEINRDPLGCAQDFALHLLVASFRFAAIELGFEQMKHGAADASREASE